MTNALSKIFRLGLILCSFSMLLGAQTPPAQLVPPPAETQDTFRISTVLVQSDVSVFDKQGNFVDGLTKDSFELKVDGKPFPIALFQRITAGSAEEEANLAAARGTWKPGTITANNPLTQGQSVIFFVDDYHLSGEHVERAQQIIYRYLDQNLRAGDRMMIASSSGQLGFLQQFSDNRDVLRLTASRLKYLPATQADTERPRMSLFEAIAASRNQPDVMEYLSQQYRAQALFAPGPNLMQLIRMRASNIIAFHRTINTAMFSTLEALLRGTSVIPGRKLVFFISSGFIIDPVVDNSFGSKLDRLIDWAARSGAVFYTVDARGLGVAMADISDRISTANEPSAGDAPADASRLLHNESMQTQQALRTLAYDTGGQPILNTNGLETKVNQVVREYQNYYVLAWEPEAFEKDKPKFRKLTVTVKDRPELQVRVRRGFFESPPPDVPITEKKVEKKAGDKDAAKPVDPLVAATRAVYPKRDLPVALYASFQNETTTGSAVSATIELPADVIAPVGGAGEVEILCVIVDSHGKAIKNDGKKLSFNRPGTVAPVLAANFQLPIMPGLYQVRASARDLRTGRIGADYQWLEIPPFAAGKLSLSSLLISEKRAQIANETLAIKTSRRFARSSKLLMQLYLYNATLATNQRPDLTMEIQVIRQAQTVQAQSVLDAPAHPVTLNGQTDLSRILYTAEIPLRGLTPGLYTLQLKATDRIKKVTETQRINFAVE